MYISLMGYYTKLRDAIICIYIYILGYIFLWLADLQPYRTCQDTEKPAAMAERRQAYKDLCSFSGDRCIYIYIHD